MNVNTTNLETNREQWASIDCYSNYEVSWFGRVRNAKTGRILKHCTDKQGYPCAGLSKNGKTKTHKIHQLVAREWVSNPDGKRCVDHIDGDKLNNHHENLRYATHTENSRNQKKRSDGSSIYKGVSLYKQRNNWTSRILVDGKAVFLGYFTNEREAAEVYNTTALENFGVFARLNTFTD